MLLRISHVRQCGPHSYIVKYNAEITLTPGEPLVVVDVLSTYPEDAGRSDVAAAAEAIRRGAERALQPRQVGAIMRLERLCIHPVDFSVQKFEQVTAEELSRAMDADT